MRINKLYFRIILLALIVGAVAFGVFTNLIPSIQEDSDRLRSLLVNTHSMEINGIVRAFYCGRKECNLTLDSGKQIEVAKAFNRSYDLSNRDFEDCLELGALIVKEPNSDSIFVYKGSKKFSYAIPNVSNTK
jgi:hypothetical protein